eukprot:Gregarina_sp_Poly_1__932@NODE_1224_length_4723_cov_22_137672_g833_i0_p2_GENE_NODE_1224_length_4723_cov_22_137672_g833_i0NODE_1224_length_4723_cov_22_137672_g833_i0_p2_ORF_typecomplete_len116_score2_55IBR/PF01485_21/0_083IBR/PF01485_21/8_1e08_NODE_1224_length_4723_cov_22_137672_g833_i0162509
MQEYCFDPEVASVIYCAQCFEVIPVFGRELVASCINCEARVCVSCQQLEHPRGLCFEDGATRAVRTQAASRGWGTCPGCRAVVEKIQGCNHIICRCKCEFCYSCGQKICECSTRT